MNKILKTTFYVIGLFFAVFSFTYISFAWNNPTEVMPSGGLEPINTSNIAQTKAGSLLIGQDLRVSGNANICELVYFDSSGAQEKCPAGYYVTEMLASAASGYMLCCKVENPL